MPEFSTFKSFYTEEEAISFSEFLNEHNIVNEMRMTKPYVDRVIGGDTMQKEFHVQIATSDFKTVNQLLDKLIGEQISMIDPDYYLFSFSNDELKDIINKPDEWNNQDVILAQKILQDRGVNITDRQVAEIKNNRVYELASPRKLSTLKIILAYIFSLVLPIYGIIVGLMYSNSRINLPDGNSVMAFNDTTRAHARAMIFLGIFVTVMQVVAVLKWQMFDN